MTQEIACGAQYRETKAEANTGLSLQRLNVHKSTSSSLALASLRQWTVSDLKSIRLLHHKLIPNLLVTNMDWHRETLRLEAEAKNLDLGNEDLQG